MKRAKSSTLRAFSTGSLLVLLALWCILTYGHILDSMFLPTPTAVIAALITMAKEGTLWLHIGSSVRRIMVGWAWSAVVAVPCGILMAVSQKFNAILQPLVEFIRYLPVVALVPLTILYMGIAESQKYTIIFIGTFFQLVLMVADAVVGIDKNLLNAARTLGASKWQTYKWVIFPAALPGIMDSFRVTIGWAWTYLVAAEMVAANSGLGYIIIKSQRVLTTDVIFAGLLMIGIIGLLTDVLFRLLSRLVAPWYERLSD